MAGHWPSFDIVIGKAMRYFDNSLWRIFIGSPYITQITKRQVDRFVPGRRVPSCQLYVKWAGQQQQPVELAHQVELLGAKEPFNYFLIHPPSVISPIPPPSMWVVGTHLNQIMTCLWWFLPTVGWIQLRGVFPYKQFSSRLSRKAIYW